MTKTSLKIVCGCAGTGLGLYATLGANLAYAGLAPAPAPLVGVAGGPVGLLAAGVAFGGYLAFKHFRNRS